MSEPNQLINQMAKAMGVEIDDYILKICIKLLDQGIDPAKLASSIKKVYNETDRF